MPRFVARSMPTSSMSGLMSADRHLRAALGHAEGDVAGAAGHVEDALAGARLHPATKRSFHSRCMPPDIESFITS